MNKENLLDMNLQYFAKDDDPADAPGAEGGQGEAETLTKEEANRLIAQQKSKAKSEAEKAYQEQIEELKNDYETQLSDVKSKLSDKDEEEFDLSKAQRELNALKEELATERQEKESLSSQIQRANMQERAVEELSEKGLPVNDKVLSFVVKDSADDTLEAIDDLAELFKEQKEEYAQTPPPLGSGGLGNSNTEQKSSKSILDEAKITDF